VWNRTAAKARALEADGAIAFDAVADAVRNVDRIHVVLTDDAAVDATLAAAKLAPGAFVIDHSTTSTRGAVARTRRWLDAGVTYLHAPVFMGPQNALESTGLMLVSGDAAVIDRARPLLAPMTGKLVELGPRVDAAAAFKLMGNLFLMAMTSGIADMLGLAKAMGVPAKEAAALFDHFNPAGSLPARAKRMVDRDFDAPSWELAMARKDARLMQNELALGDVAIALLPAIVARMDQVLAQGLGDKDWTVIAQDFVR